MSTQLYRDVEKDWDKLSELDELNNIRVTHKNNFRLNTTSEILDTDRNLDPESVVKSNGSESDVEGNEDDRVQHSSKLKSKVQRSKRKIEIVNSPEDFNELEAQKQSTLPKKCKNFNDRKRCRVTPTPCELQIKICINTEGPRSPSSNRCFDPASDVHGIASELEVRPKTVEFVDKNLILGVSVSLVSILMVLLVSFLMLLVITVELQKMFTGYAKLQLELDDMKESRDCNWMDEFDEEYIDSLFDYER